MATTYNGDALAGKLNPAIGTTREIRETCARICRAAATLHRLNEEACNGHPAQSGTSGLAWERVDQLQAAWDVRVEAQTEQVIRRLESLVADLPHTDLGPFKLQAEEDPRGCSLIIVPDGCGISGDSFLRLETRSGERNGVCIPMTRR